MNLRNKLANKASERQPRLAGLLNDRFADQFCGSYEALAFIFFLVGGSPIGDFFFFGSRIGGLFSGGGFTGGLFEYGDSLLGDSTAFMMETILICFCELSLHWAGVLNGKILIPSCLKHQSRCQRAVNTGHCAKFRDRLNNPISWSIVMFVQFLFVVPIQVIGIEFWPALNRFT